MQSKAAIGTDEVSWSCLLEVLGRGSKWAAALEIYSEGRRRALWQNYSTDMGSPTAGACLHLNPNTLIPHLRREWPH